MTFSTGLPRAAAPLVVLAGLALAVVDRDEVKSIPGFAGKSPSRQWSGYVEVKGSSQHWFTHYMLTESQREGGGLTSDPLTLWQQGGPGSSGFGYGYFAELGPYRLTADSLLENTTEVPAPSLNPYSWDHVSNLVIFEHPPGTGFSYCVDGQGAVVACEWNDQTAGEAFYQTLVAFYKLWSEFQGKELHVIGESYAGLLIPFLVNEIAKNEESAPFTLASFAVGNGCPGTSGATPNNRGSCNGPYGSYDTQHIVELAYGHSAVSRQLYTSLAAECGFPCAAKGWNATCNTYSEPCRLLLEQFSAAVGPFNIYNFYDNCGPGNQVDSEHHRPRTLVEHLNEAEDPHSGGQSYPCGTGLAATTYLNIPSVRQAFNMKPASFYGRPWGLQAGTGMNYTTYTGSSFDLYPSLLRKFRAVVYNGDVDACVPYNSNEDWVVALGLPAAEAWRPWLVDNIVAGYVSTFRTDGPANFTFITIKEAGHMVPQYQPQRALAFFRRWLANEPF